MELEGEIETALRFRAKAVLRQRARALRNTIPQSAVAERSAKIVDLLAALPLLEAARTLALFYPIESRNEIDLRPLDARLRARGARIAYPSIEAESRVMTFRFVDALSELAERGLGFREPDPSADEASALDVIVVPALQIDARGHRIGYGAGFYDRTLPRFAPPAHTIGVAFSFQLVPEIPTTEGDVSVSLIVTDGRIIEPVSDEACTPSAAARA